jgi:hypothetical protein
MPRRPIGCIRTSVDCLVGSRQALGRQTPYLRPLLGPNAAAGQPATLEYECIRNVILALAPRGCHKTSTPGPFNKTPVAGNTGTAASSRPERGCLETHAKPSSTRPPMRRHLRTGLVGTISTAMAASSRLDGRLLCYRSAHCLSEMNWTSNGLTCAWKT